MIDIEECKQIADLLRKKWSLEEYWENKEKVDHMREDAVALFPDLVDELIEARKPLADELKVGDEVEATGPDVDGRGIGLKFKINDISRCGEKVYTGYNVWYYPASSLRKIQPNQTLELRDLITDGLFTDINAKFGIQDVHNAAFAKDINVMRERLDSLLADYREEKQKRLDMLDRIKEIEEESSSQHCQTQVLMTAQARTDRRISGMVERLAKIEAALRSV